MYQRIYYKSSQYIYEKQLEKNITKISELSKSIKLYNKNDTQELNSKCLQLKSLIKNSNQLL